MKPLWSESILVGNSQIQVGLELSMVCESIFEAEQGDRRVLILEWRFKLTWRMSRTEFMITSHPVALLVALLYVESVGPFILMFCAS